MWYRLSIPHLVTMELWMKYPHTLISPSLKQRREEYSSYSIASSDVTSEHCPSSILKVSALVAEPSRPPTYPTGLFHYSKKTPSVASMGRRDQKSLVFGGYECGNRLYKFIQRETQHLPWEMATGKHSAPVERENLKTGKFI